ncbi:molybdopterin-guanine dinucleotide biosynthesis protein B [Lederbergia sp. NSJ-179]|uniref:molybdopterin-guanine dinucleotide biosynthesis protein B n=1 Tax=Lederbergia sp. NSJ-179 TaxID=2931402 RepID=UPI001FCFFA88|nr:molybdopterin-guanine dinucleotide biosynthesis protein B [Lederbergia sp. NSJ-179]MCJ7841179.1 molybdopterin-guanine dinucleotide biosynthesis protein B [Lederbergia sp. NSJ-179]
MDRTKVFQIVGFQNSGKTTLMEKLISYGRNREFRLGTIKQHGHGGPPEGNMLHKDSKKHVKAGAMIAAVEGDGMLQLEARNSSWNLDDILSIYQSLPIDLILVEGYKKAAFPKIVMTRHQEDLHLLTNYPILRGLFLGSLFISHKRCRFIPFIIVKDLLILMHSYRIGTNIWPLKKQVL